MMAAPEADTQSHPAVIPTRPASMPLSVSTLNTDNRMVSNSTIAKEMEFVQINYGIKDEELRKMTENAIEASFAEDEVRQMLWKQMRS